MAPPRFALLIANGRYSDPNLHDLSLPSSNVEILREVLITPRLRAFAVVDTLNDCSSKELREAIQDILARAEGSQVLFYYSGSVATDKQGDLCLIASDTRLDRLAETSVSVDWLSYVTGMSRATTIGIILDVGHCRFLTWPGQIPKLPQFDPRVSLIDSLDLTYRDNDNEGLSILTSLMVRGIRDGSADVNRDGLITLDDLDLYVAWSTAGRIQRRASTARSGQLVVAHSRLDDNLHRVEYDNVSADNAATKTACVPVNSHDQDELPTRMPLPKALRAGGYVFRAPPFGFEPAPKYISVRVFYGTSRLPSGSPSPDVFYGYRRANEIQLGECKVTIPKGHRIGTLESPSVLRLQFRQDPEEHVVLYRVTPCPAGQFFVNLRLAVTQARRHECLVFVHGFNVSFADAARRTAQIAHDLAFEGTPIFYSWPSRGRLSLAGYRHDANNVKWAVPHLVTFLNEVSYRSGAETIHLIAHSMGNQVLADALAALASQFRETSRPRFTEVVLTAPDIDADVFTEMAELFRRAAKRVTLYASSNDLALGFSKRYQGNYPRAGDSGKKIVIVRGVDTIDASRVDTNLIGHFYYADNKSVLSDIFSLVTHGDPPGERFGLLPQTSDRGLYWLFRP